MSVQSRDDRAAVPTCYDDVCITCSDQAVQVRVVQLLDDALALVDTGVSHEEVSVALVDAQVGDTILVHAKEAIAVITGVPGEQGDGGSPPGEQGNLGGQEKKR